MRKRHEHMSRHESVQRPCRKRKHMAYISYSCKCNQFFTQGKQRKTKRKDKENWGGVGWGWGESQSKGKSKKEKLILLVGASFRLPG